MCLILCHTYTMYKSIIVLLLVFLGSTWAQNSRCCTQTDHGYELGCFTDAPPFDNMPLPECPCSGTCGADTLTYPQFILYTQANRNVGVIFDRNEVPNYFDGSRRTIFVGHGWNANVDGWCMTVKDGLLDKGDFNVVLVDWRDGAGRVNYMQSASNTRTVGYEAGHVIDNLIANGGADRSRMECVGHSLGAHMCGHNGNYDRLDRVTGLDPAGPSFQNSADRTIGLNPGSGNFVDAIHTDGKDRVDAYGTLVPMGHMDFYPNEGGLQPGCIDVAEDDIDTHIACSHSRAHEYYLESIGTGCFLSSDSCTDENNIPGSCTNCGSVCASMGYDARGSGSDGLYYLTTNAASPFCQS